MCLCTLINKILRHKYSALFILIKHSPYRWLWSLSPHYWDRRMCSSSAYNDTPDCQKQSWTSCTWARGVCPPQIAWMASASRTDLWLGVWTCNDPKRQTSLVAAVRQFHSLYFLRQSLHFCMVPDFGHDPKQRICLL